MSQPPPHRYLARGRADGVSETVLRAAVKNTTKTDAHDALSILSLGHLSHLTGAPYLYLRGIVQRTSDPYDDIMRKKQTGGSRLISAPEPVLMDVQRLILERALTGTPMHPASFAYRRKRSTLMCAQQHVGARWMLKFDLHDFFGSITEVQVYKVFRSRGYEPLVSFELARLCTRSTTMPSWSTRHQVRYPVIQSYNGRTLGSLPQGGPTSGALANAVATPLDNSLSDLSHDHGFTYTRYSDDLVFSSANKFDRTVARAIINAVRRCVSGQGFRLHAKKTRIIPPGARHIVLGLMLSDDGVRLTPEFRRRIEVHVHGVSTFGLLAHAEFRRFRSVFSFINHVDGCLAFAESVESPWALRLRGEWQRVLRKEGFPAM
ncbi:reverse transcriptase family protein [Modestobacter sp. Leaf380]|uniref:reverse transcriptase family protein n=1 Tax=Modestobacter sp. Leaf380 TaxID=1736356 RepID=UPI0009E9DFA5|nr:reverse transcriptase family protein [Modestobacter sp. Leaf380]